MRPQIWKDTAEMMCMLRFLSSGTGWFHRRATGKGRKIRVSIYEFIVHFQLMTFENNVHFYDLYVGPNIFLRCLIVSMIFNRKGGICPLLRNGAMEATEALSVVPVVAILMTLGACILTEFPHGCHSQKVLHYVPNHGNPATLLNSANACCDTFGSCSLHFPIIASLRIATRSFSFNETSEKKQPNEPKKALLFPLDDRNTLQFEPRLRAIQLAGDARFGAPPIWAQLCMCLPLIHL